MTSACSSIDIFDSEGKNDGWYFCAMAMLVVKGESVSRDRREEKKKKKKEKEYEYKEHQVSYIRGTRP